MEGRGLEVKEGEFALKCRIAFHLKSALCCPLAPAPYPCSLRARQVLYLPGDGWSPLSGLVGMCVCGLWRGMLQTFVCRVAGVLGSAESASSAAWDRAVRSAARPLSSARVPNGT